MFLMKDWRNVPGTGEVLPFLDKVGDILHCYSLQHYAIHPDAEGGCLERHRLTVYSISQRTVLWRGRMGRRR
jgi:hypothetical protein